MFPIMPRDATADAICFQFGRRAYPTKGMLRGCPELEHMDRIFVFQGGTPRAFHANDIHSHRKVPVKFWNKILFLKKKLTH